MERREHIPVLLEEVLEYLAPQQGQTFIDATLGLGGHTIALAKRIGKRGRVWAIDQDSESIVKARQYLKKAKVEQRVSVVHGNFSDLSDIARENKIEKVNGVLIDAGVSSYQLDEKSRGFSYESSILDMRMDCTQGRTASDILMRQSQEYLERIFREYGDERLARPIAKGIIEARHHGALSAQTLVELIERVYQRAYRRRSTTHPAAKVFLALRIAVNDELNALSQGLQAGIELLVSKGRIAIITFHSGEHRRVKQVLRQEARDCLCPAEIPICICQHTKQIKIITKKPIIPHNTQIHANPRSRSSHLYIAEKL